MTNRSSITATEMPDAHQGGCGLGSNAPRGAPSDVAEVFTAGESEGRGFDRLDGGEDTGDLIVESADGAQHEELGGGFGEHDPFAATGVDEGAGLEGEAVLSIGRTTPSICGAGKAADTGIADIAAGRFGSARSTPPIRWKIIFLLFPQRHLPTPSSNTDTEQ